MTIKLETGKPIISKRAQAPRADFLCALRDMKVGQSFKWNMSQYDRAAISVAQVLLERRYETRKDGDNGERRIWRIS